MIVFERGNLLWIFNFHTSQSYTDYRIGTEWAGTYKVVLDSDATEFGGHSRVNDQGKYVSVPQPWCDRDNYIQVYIPCRTLLILALE